MSALDDLRRCLERTHQHEELVREFRGALLSRLLQPGANTSEILDIYVSTIKVRVWNCAMRGIPVKPCYTSVLIEVLGGLIVL